MTQDEALALLKTGASIFLTGQPGSGKTHTVNRYIEALKRQGIEYAYTASTGIAATHGHGITIHAWSGIGVRETLTRRDLDTLAANRRLAARIERTQRADHRRDLDAAGAKPHSGRRGLPPCQGMPAPFGGMQIVLVGDFFQLPPVVRRDAQAAMLPLGDGADGFGAIRPRLARLARSCAHGLLSLGAAPAKRRAVSRRARRDPRQCLHRHSSRASCRAADREGSPARRLHASLHP